MSKYRPPGPWALVNIYFTDTTKEWTSELWFTTTDPFLSTFDQNGLAVAFAGYLIQPFTDPMADTSFSNGLLLEINNGVGSVSIKHYVQNDGGSSTDSMPIEVAVVVAKIRNTGSALSKGRIFVSGWAQENFTKDVLSATGVTAMGVLVAALKLPLTNQSQTWHPAMTNFNTSTLLTEIGKVDSWLPTANVGTQRRRRPRF